MKISYYDDARTLERNYEITIFKKKIHFKYTLYYSCLFRLELFEIKEYIKEKIIKILDSIVRKIINLKIRIMK